MTDIPRSYPLGGSAPPFREQPMTNELLPCPFCGGEQIDAHLAGSAWFIGGNHAETCHFADFQRTEAEAIAAWNTRPIATPSDDKELATWREAYDSTMDSLKRGELAGWEMDLLRRRVEAAISTLSSEKAALREALEFYADPENYHAIGFMFDRPCGSFEDDFGDGHGHEDYDRPMPGKRARAALSPDGGRDGLAEKSS